jgi:hypothetical protein
MFLFWGREVYLGFYVGEFPMFQMMSKHSRGFTAARFGWGLSRDRRGVSNQSQIIKSKSYRQTPIVLYK